LGVRRGDVLSANGPGEGLIQCFFKKKKTTGPRTEKRRYHGDHAEEKNGTRGRCKTGKRQRERKRGANNIKMNMTKNEKEETDRKNKREGSGKAAST